MRELAKKYCASYLDKSPGTKLLYTLLWNVPNNLYRFFKSEIDGSVLGMALALVTMTAFGPISAVVDMVTLFANGKVYWMGEDIKRPEYEYDGFTPKNHGRVNFHEAAEIEAGMDMADGSFNSPLANGWMDYDEYMKSEQKRKSDEEQDR